MWPVYNRTVHNGSDSSNPYENPGAPVHFITGSAVSCIISNMYMESSGIVKGRPGQSRSHPTSSGMATNMILSRVHNREESI